MIFFSAAGYDNGANTVPAAPAFSLYNGQFVDQSFDSGSIILLAADGRDLVNTAGDFTLTATNGDATDISNERTVHYLTCATDAATPSTAALTDYPKRSS